MRVIRRVWLDPCARSEPVLRGVGRVARALVLAAAAVAVAIGPVGAETLDPDAFDSDTGAVTGSFTRSLVPDDRGILLAPDEVRPGDVARIVVARGEAPDRVDLVNANGDVLTGGYRIDVQMTAAVPLAVYLLGIDSTVVPGEYVIRGVGTATDSALGSAFERRVVVGAREFRAEEIPLTASLTALRSEYDPRKVEESRVLSDLVLSRDPEALYHPGRLAWPLPEDTRRTSFFGDRRTYLYSDGERARSIHVGLDLAAPVGTPVASVGAGVVRMARDRIVTGKTVVIELLPGVYCLYYHLDELAVAEGDLVEAGTIVGTVGMTGLATGPHLHWEFRVGGVPVSPERVMERTLLLGEVSP